MNQISGIAIALSVAWFLTSCSQSPTYAPTASSAKHFTTSKAERQKMSVAERLAWLEQNGEVPVDADEMDWHLAQRTSWWGKPLDPKQFWSNRVLWCDGEAVAAAQRHGRGEPPIPYEDKSLSVYPDDEKIDWGSYDVEGRNLHFATSSKEGGFWGKFGRTMPHPPERLAREQIEVATSVMKGRYYFEQRSNLTGASAHGLATTEAGSKGRAQELGTPPEALTEEALLWAYTLSMRHQYEDRAAKFGADSRAVKDFLSRAGLDSKLITDPLTEDQQKAANAWKMTYLQRLRNEKADESYISAYLQAWNLSETAVFGGTNGP